MSLLTWLFGKSIAPYKSPPGYAGCWSCGKTHTGHCWCPHCHAPCDVDSTYARNSPYWAKDPRNPHARRA